MPFLPRWFIHVALIGLFFGGFSLQGTLPGAEIDSLALPQTPLPQVFSIHPLGNELDLLHLGDPAVPNPENSLQVPDANLPGAAGIVVPKPKRIADLQPAGRIQCACRQYRATCFVCLSNLGDGCNTCMAGSLATVRFFSLRHLRRLGFCCLHRMANTCSPWDDPRQAQAYLNAKRNPAPAPAPASQSMDEQQEAPSQQEVEPVDCLFVGVESPEHHPRLQLPGALDPSQDPA